MGKQFCVFRNCSTIDTLGKGEMPASCRNNGCNGGPFSARPECKTFMRDALPPEPPFGKMWVGAKDFSNIIKLENQRLPAPSIFLDNWRLPARAVGER